MTSLIVTERLDFQVALDSMNRLSSDQQCGFRVLHGVLLPPFFVFDVGAKATAAFHSNVRVACLTVEDRSAISKGYLNSAGFIRRPHRLQLWR